MPTRRLVRFIAALSVQAIGTTLLATSTFAAVQLADVQLVATTPTLLQQAPQAQTLTVTTAAKLRATMVDASINAPLTSMSLIVVSGTQSVLKMSQAGSMDFDAVPGTYTVRALGAGPNDGAINVKIGPAADSTTSLLQFSAQVKATTSLLPNQLALSVPLVVASAGNYQVTITDRAFPSAVDLTDILIIRRPPATQFYRICLPANAPDCASGPPPTTGPIALAADTYDINIRALAQTTTNAGLFSVNIGGAGGTIYGATFPVGVLQPQATLNFPAADQYSLSLSDVNFPAPLGQMNALIAQGGDVIATAASATPVPFTASPGDAALYVRAAPGAAAEAGTFGVQVAGGATSIYDDVRTVTSATSSLRAYAFPANIAAAGTYHVRVRDFGFPSAIPVLQAAVTQHGASLAALPNAGTKDATIAAGPIVIVVLANMMSPTATGLLGVGVDAAASGATVYETTQGVGDLFHTRTFTASATGNLDVSLNDLGFPAAFSDLALAVTRGTALVGQIFGGGKFTFPATAGTYSLNFIARAGTTNYGLYGTQVEDTPPPPVVTLTATPARIASGGVTKLDWTATGATSCVASGGWSGTQPTSGSMNNVGPFNMDTTLTLTCTGAGGSSSAAANITIATDSGKSGGGTLTIPFLAVVLAFMLQRFVSRRRSVKVEAR